MFNRYSPPPRNLRFRGKITDAHRLVNTELTQLVDTVPPGKVHAFPTNNPS